MSLPTTQCWSIGSTQGPCRPSSQNRLCADGKLPSREGKGLQSHPVATRVQPPQPAFCSAPRHPVYIPPATPCTASALATAFQLLPQHFPASGPLRLLFPLLRTLFCMAGPSRCSAGSLSTVPSSERPFPMAPEIASPHLSHPLAQHRLISKPLLLPVITIHIDVYSSIICQSFLFTTESLTPRAFSTW